MAKYLFILLLLLSARLYGQVNPDSIIIARDSFGIPHIFANTDAEAAYGLAWAQAEDDFESVQLLMLSGKAMLGSAIGKKGAEADYVVHLLRCRQLVEEQWGTLAPEFLALIKGYVDGLSAYARAYPGRVKYKRAFPFTEKDYMTAVVFSLNIFCGADKALSQVLGGKIATIPGFAAQGSNAIAIHASRTNTGEAFLAINAHQPLEGPTAFYEAHVKTKQGWNMLGGSFPGGCLIFHGTNENLGWANTINYMDKIDVFQLEINPSNSNQYKFDGRWIDLESRKIKLKVKRVPVTISRKVLWSKYGPTVKTGKGVFALRIIGNMDIRALEQWYRMNKAKNFSEFYKALGMTSLPMFNIMYADRYDTIFYISNGKIPHRNPNRIYNWKSTLPGNVSATLWTTFKSVGELPQYLNPRSGYLYNTNHSPFRATDPAENLDSRKFDIADGFEMYDNNRSQRITELIKDIDKFDYAKFKQIKFDWTLPRDLKYPYEIDSLFILPANEYPELAETITTFQQWDRAGSVDSKGAAIFLLIYHYVVDSMAKESPRQLTKPEAIYIYRYVKDYMIRYFGKIGITLGEIQKMVRGDQERPAFGLPDVLAAAYSEPYRNGRRKVVSGDAYIAFVRYPKNGLPLIESVNTFGASANPRSPHFADQMDLFGRQQTKRMSLDESEILRSAKRVYHPKK